MEELTVRGEVYRLIAEMKAKAKTLEDLRDTVHAECLVQQRVIPELPSRASRSFVQAIARATVLGAMIELDARQRGYL